MCFTRPSGGRAGAITWGTALIVFSIKEREKISLWARTHSYSYLPHHIDSSRCLRGRSIAEGPSTWWRCCTHTHYPTWHLRSSDAVPLILLSHDTRQIAETSEPENAGGGGLALFLSLSLDASSRTGAVEIRSRVTTHHRWGTETLAAVYGRSSPPVLKYIPACHL